MHENICCFFFEYNLQSCFVCFVHLPSLIHQFFCHHHQNRVWFLDLKSSYAFVFLICIISDLITNIIYLCHGLYLQQLTALQNLYMAHIHGIIPVPSPHIKPKRAFTLKPICICLGLSMSSFWLTCHILYDATTYQLYHPTYLNYVDEKQEQKMIPLHHHHHPYHNVLVVNSTIFEFV